MSDHAWKTSFCWLLPDSNPLWSETASQHWWKHSMCGDNQQLGFDGAILTQSTSLKWMPSVSVNQICNAPLSLRKSNPQIHPILSSNISTTQKQKAKVFHWGFFHPQRRLRCSIKHLMSCWKKLEVTFTNQGQGAEHRKTCLWDETVQQTLFTVISCSYTPRWTARLGTSARTIRIPDFCANKEPGKSRQGVPHAWWWLPAAGSDSQDEDTALSCFRPRMGYFHMAVISHTVNLTHPNILHGARQCKGNLMPYLAQTCFLLLLNIGPKLQVEKHWA